LKSPLANKYPERKEKEMKKLCDVDNEKMCGGKAINLAKLQSAGFLVKNAIVIEVEEVKNIIERQYVSKKLIDRIQQILDFSNCGVAVRSSAVGEDRDLSWAGQFKSRLFIKCDELDGAVVECANAQNSEIVESYAKLHNVEVPPLALIVQEMVNAKVSGVVFTVNPITKENEIIIEATCGVSDSLTNGSCKPMCYYLDSNTLQLVKKEGKEGKLLLSFEQILKLASIAKKIHNLFGMPQDIEWALERSTHKFFLNQSRNITALEMPYKMKGEFPAC
jgi:pyruvate,water dikinase